MQTLSIIKSEHRNLAAVLFCLDKLVDEIDQNHKQPDFRLLHGIMHYLDAFLDTYHHPKETAYLFPVLRRRCPEAQQILKDLEQEHVDGERLAVQLLKALSAYEFRGTPAFKAFRDLAKHYIQFERAHALREEREVLPRARETLFHSDWQRLDAIFTDHNDPLFGDSPQHEFGTLHQLIANLTPAPYGLGAEWQRAGDPTAR